MQQLSLFAESTPVLPITYYPDFLEIEQANSLYQQCLKLMSQPLHQSAWGHVANSTLNPLAAGQQIFGWNTGVCL